LSELRKKDVDSDPLKQFDRWFQEGQKSQPVLPEAAALATASDSGQPSVRTVLLKGVDEGGFVFFTNYESQKAREIEENPRAALVFHWRELERQITIRGAVSRVSTQESEDYFRTRPVGSQIAASVSPQSQVVESRRQLEDSFEKLTSDSQGKEIPRPSNWGGYRLSPITIEFWQGRPNRLHDRILYTKEPHGNWRIDRLAP